MKPIYLLAMVPPLLNAVGAFYSQTETPFIFGVPPMLAWLVGCVIVTSIVMQVIYLVDQRDTRRKNALNNGDAR